MELRFELGHGVTLIKKDEIGSIVTFLLVTGTHTDASARSRIISVPMLMAT